jgi:hypothetical protein
MKDTELKRFATLYEQYLKLLIPQGKSDPAVRTCSQAVQHVICHLISVPGQVDQGKRGGLFFPVG